MDYYPFFRGKQYELICIRENADLISANGFIPILEPVREDVSGLKRCLDAISAARGKILVVENPGCGALEGRVSNAIKDLVESFRGEADIGWVHRYSAGSDVESFLEREGGGVILHDSLSASTELKAAEAASGWVAEKHIFVDHKDSGLLYRRQFSGSNRVILQDGFRKKKNSAYLDDPIEHFSDLYLTYHDMAVQGFGDFLTVGDDYSEGGGPAYAVAIHITFVDRDREGSLLLRHFVSDSNDTPADPAGKFAEALSKLAVEARVPGSKIPPTRSIQEFLELHDRGHYPGLGYVKKLSMQHHLEVMALLTTD